jgi:hypothetical protein
MKTWQKFGGFAALYLAIVNLIGMVLFLVVLDYRNITNPAEKVAMIVEKHNIIFSTNLLMYVFFGIFLIILSVALYHRLKSAAPGLVQAAALFGIIWAGSLIASGMVANAGIDPTVALYAQDPSQAALSWQNIETVANGLGNANGEILGGLLTLLVSLAALRAGAFPKVLNFLGLVVGTAGIISLVPGFSSLMTSVFGLGQIVWFIWLGILLLRKNEGRTV